MKEKSKKKVISILGTVKDRPESEWRPTVGLVQQEDLHFDELYLVYDKDFKELAQTVTEDIKKASETEVTSKTVKLENPWDFEEVYEKFYKLAKDSCFHEEDTEYYIHITTGSHVEQICLFLLAESHQLPGKLIQTYPDKTSTPPKVKHTIIDLNLACYTKLAKRFEKEYSDNCDFLKQGIETTNKAFNELIETIERVAIRSSAPILLTGPTGAGKSQLANQIYKLKKLNGQVTGTFVNVNCATLGGELAKSALFGYKKGAFTGAEADHDGFLKEANGGILFLDEIGELPLEAQAMLLKAIEEQTFRPLGATADEKSNFQLICGTNRDLAKEVEDKRFRADLFARINLWTFKLPGLADRPEDIEPNLDYELARYFERTGKKITFNTDARKRFLAFALNPATRWPGNFRDLNAMVVRMATLSDDGIITQEGVEEEIKRYESNTLPASVPIPLADDALLRRILGDDYTEHFDSVNIALLAHTIAVCRTSSSAADAATKLFAVSRKPSTNDSDRLIKFLKRFELKFKEIQGA